jgi:hypothetical protein
MGGAFIAVADDATASSWNPAGLGLLERPEGSVVWKPRERHTLDYSPKTNRYVLESQAARFTDSSEVYQLRARGLEFASITFPLKLRGFTVVPQFNYQRAVERGYTYEPVKRLLRSTEITSTANPASGTLSDEVYDYDRRIRSHGALDIWAVSVAARRNTGLSFGLSINRWAQNTVGDVSLRESRSICATDVRSCERISGDTIGFFQAVSHGLNANLGILMRPSKALRAGLVFKTAFMMHTSLEETSSQEFSSVKNDAQGNQFGSRQTASTRGEETGAIHWPWTIGTGISFQPTEVLTIATDLTITEWSRAVYVGERDLSQSMIQVESSGSPRFTTFAEKTDQATFWPTLITPGRPGPDHSREQIDGYQARVGAEYVLLRRKLVFPLRAGAFLDRLYFTNGKGNDVYFVGWTAGAGVGWSNLLLDGAYVRRQGHYSLDYSDSTPDATFISRQQTSLRDDRFESDRVYLSLIVRF